MNLIEALASAIDAALVRQMAAYKQQSHSMLLAGETETAQILAHKAEALREASVTMLTAVQRFKDAEEE